MRDDENERVLLAEVLNQRPCWLVRWGLVVFVAIILIFLFLARSWC